MNFELSLETEYIQHSRKDYDFIDLLGDIGGIQTMFFGVFAFFFVELSEFFMLLDLFNFMFKLRENDALLLFNHDGYVK